jgi:hypothetical protein
MIAEGSMRWERSGFTGTNSGAGHVNLLLIFANLSCATQRSAAWRRVGRTRKNYVISTYLPLRLQGPDQSRQQWC